MSRSLALLCLLLGIWSTTSGAQEPELAETHEFGFEEDLVLELPEAEAAPEAPPAFGLLPRWTLDAWTAYRFRTERLVSNRLSLRLELEQLWGERWFWRFDGKSAWNLIYNEALYPERDYPEAVREEFRWWTSWREGFVQGRFGALSLKIGQQVLVWGKADASVVTDLISPRDQTELFSTPVDESRIGQRLLTLDYYPGANQQLTLFLNPDPQVNRYAPAGHEYALSAADAGFVVLPEQLPVFGKEPEFGLRWASTREAVDFSACWAELMDNDPVYVRKRLELQMVGGVPTPVPVLEPQYRRFRLLGGGAQVGSGDFLWKGEGALWLEKDFVSSAASGDGTTERTVRVLALGMDYSKAAGDQWSLEASSQWIEDWDASLTDTQEQQELVFASWTRRFLHETLAPQVALLHQPSRGEWMLQGELQYDWSDVVQVRMATQSFQVHREDTSLGQLSPLRQLSFQLSAVF